MATQFTWRSSASIRTCWRSIRPTMQGDGAICLHSTMARLWAPRPIIRCWLVCATEGLLLTHDLARIGGVGIDQAGDVGLRIQCRDGGGDEGKRLVCEDFKRLFASALYPMFPRPINRATDNCRS